MNWHILTGEYPPQPGGVSDYTRVIANGLVAAGDSVHLWAPAIDQPACCDRGVIVHRLPGRFGPKAWRRLDSELRSTTPSRVLVQYVPQAFGWRGMNLPFCLWLYARRKLGPIVMFHEVMYPIERGASWQHRTLGAISALMAAIVARAAAAIFVSTPIWQELLRTKLRITKPSAWLPLPSTVPVIVDQARIADVRRRFAIAGGLVVGHFSSYPTATRHVLSSIILALLKFNAGLSVMLIGSASEDFRAELTASTPSLAARLYATGQLALEDVSLHLAACDAMLQPYPDGACARRTTLIAAIAHGRPVVTNAGPATEAFWQSSGAVALVEKDGSAALIEALRELLEDPERRRGYGEAATRLYARHFELSHAIRMLRGVGCVSQ